MKSFRRSSHEMFFHCTGWNFCAFSAVNYDLDPLCERCTDGNDAGPLLCSLSKLLCGAVEMSVCLVRKDNKLFFSRHSFRTLKL
mmetsp:Transcript_7507/g.11451  ORF Transcript_7507/g.11451 Transcript_7507/m.11451 type:complete len:84 (-) Transcript_7507:236-487(-)